MRTILCVILFLPLYAMANYEPVEIDADWLNQHLKKDGPKLVWQAGDEALIRERIQTDPVARAYHDYLIRLADALIEEPVLERILEGRRLLDVSRNAIKRSTTLAYAWRTTGKKKYLNRLEAHLEAVCSFTDWNPSHFLDTAEMSTAVALGIDWAGDDLKEETRKLALDALYEKGLVAGLDKRAEWAFTAGMNWSQVCNAGMVSAALLLADRDPELSLFTINRMLSGIQNVLEAYYPDGVYPEGATYWMYGTVFHVYLISMLETALGTDFKMPEATGFMESADFIHLMTAPSGRFYNYFDCGISGNFNHPMMWFAMKTGLPRHAQAEQMEQWVRRDPDPGSQSYRFGAMAFLWYVHYEPKNNTPLPLAWSGQGENPIGVIRSSHTDPDALYLAFKGGRGVGNHGNMDGGSFILELDGIRWSIDMGNQAYHVLEEYYKVHGGSLWDNTQDSERWKLLTKNNFGHSTLTIDGELHLNTGQTRIVDFDAENRTAVLDMSGPFMPKVMEAERIFSVPDDRTVEIVDRLSFVEPVESIRWQLTTQAEVATFPGGAILQQDGKSLKLEIVEPEGLQVSVTSLNPPPHEMDKLMRNLKRVDINIPGYMVQSISQDQVLNIKVRLSGQ